MRKGSKKNSPRYITIRIQYYPFNNKIFLLPVFIIVLFLFLSTASYIKNHWVTVYATHSTKLLHDSLLSLPDGENFVPPQAIQHKQVIMHGPRETNKIALTFDADMTPGMKSLLDSGEASSYYNKAVIDVLTQTQTKATLFLAGMWIESYPDVTKELAQNSLFELTSHSYSHPGFDGACYGLSPINDEKDREEIEKTQKLLKEFTGIDNKYFRFPGGCYSKHDIDAVNQEGLEVIHWDVAGKDGFNEDTTEIENNVINNVQNGSIIVLHMHGAENAPKTAEALPKIISVLREKGYVFVKVSELLHEPKTAHAVDIRSLLGKHW
jgi:peptidoglycan-N-acetylglucosamine deacetylase